MTDGAIGTAHRPGRRVTGRRTSRRPGSRRLGGVARAVVAGVVGLLFIAPLYWVLVTSTLTTSEAYNFSWSSLVPHWSFTNYERAWHAAPWERFFSNTIFIAVCTVALAIFTSLLAGYAFSVMRFRGRGALFGLVLSVMMVPQTVLLIPDYIIAQHLHLLDTYWIQILPFGASVFGIFLVRQFFLNVPTELFEAAELDGAGPIRMLFSIGLPMVRPALLVLGLQVLMGSWNAFLWPYVMTDSNAVRPIEVGLSVFSGTNGTDYTGLCAGVTFTTVPVLVVFLLLQKHFITGAFSSAGGVRG
ncbi:ABC transporter permease subunit [Flexivirga oryzae]|uniref:Multiple sugar transport system permease protein n=1 Tax=Flexivirga oryzae TaxID=1794944 RepID=A0A839N9E4_9MICO|nr:multiple sugar transport system permease protein [Flexivirga oryzae]